MTPIRAWLSLPKIILALCSTPLSLVISPRQPIASPRYPPPKEGKRG